MKAPTTPKGTRDFSPVELYKREYIINTIKSNFQKFGFAPIETPSFENLEVLTGKYGEEGDQLIFKILNSGDYLKNTSDEELKNRNLKQILPKISEKALRYDLTVPFARYVVNHQNEISFPFKRYQIQPVWRADRPQKGRYREFYQCDADVVGSDSLWCEVDLILLFNTVFKGLNLLSEIQINNRKILSGLAEIANIQDLIIPFTVALDKLDKIGEEKVKTEMLSKGISEKAIQILNPLFDLNGDFESQLKSLETILSSSEKGLKGIEELRFVYEKVSALGLGESELTLNTTLARGLNYYTGTILEVKAKNIELGSIGGGGRYDDLTGVFGLKNMPGVGISFGLDRIYLALEQNNLFPESNPNQLQVLFLNLGEKEAQKSMQYILKLRENDIHCALYPSEAKFKKQMQYANKIGVENLAIIGDKELENETISLKNMQSGTQETVSINDLIHQLKNN